jgi:hypothetical protein
MANLFGDIGLLTRKTLRLVGLGDMVSDSPVDTPRGFQTTTNEITQSGLLLKVSSKQLAFGGA